MGKKKTDDFNSEGGFLITEEHFFKAWNECENADKNIEKLEQFMAKYKKMQSDLFVLIRKNQIECLIPKINITEIHPTYETITAQNKSVAFPHLRGVATYEFKGAKKRFNIFIGPLSDYPKGRQDKLAMDVAKKKAFNFLKKHHPELFK